MSKSPTLRRILRWGASVLAGGILALAAPMYAFPFLAWIGLLPAIWAALDAETDKRSFLQGLVTGVVFSIPTFHWLLTSLRSFMGLSLPAALLVFLFLSLWLAIPFATISLLLRLAHRRTRLPLTLIAPTTLVATELILPSVVAWSLACTQAWVLPILQLAELTGP